MMRFSYFLSLVLSLVAAAFLAVACSGQAQQSDTALREAEDSDLIVQPFNLTIEGIEEDADLLNPSSEEVGAIEAVLVDASGRPVAITAEVGSFLGMDEMTVVIGLDRLQVNADGDLVTALTGEELQRLPAWNGY